MTIISVEVSFRKKVMSSRTQLVYLLDRLCMTCVQSPQPRRKSDVTDLLLGAYKLMSNRSKSSSIDTVVSGSISEAVSALINLFKWLNSVSNVLLQFLGVSGVVVPICLYTPYHTNKQTDRQTNKQTRVQCDSCNAFSGFHFQVC
jgi:hypothetical protein